MSGSSKELKKLFASAELAGRRKNCRQAAVFGAVFMLVGSSLDAVVYPERLLEFFFVRLGTAVGLLAFGLSGEWVKSNNLSRAVVHVVALLPLAAIAYIIAVTEGAQSPYYAGLNLVLVGATLLLRWTALDSILNLLFCLLLYALAVKLYGSAWRESFIPGYFIFVTGAIACAGTYFFNQARFREFCLGKQIGDAKNELEKSYQQLKAMDDTKSRFFANISHELRTPLTLILGPAENLRGNKKYSKDIAFLEHLDTIEDNAYRLLRLINDILDLVKLDSDETQPRPEAVNVAEFIRGLTNNLRAVAKLKNIAISCSSHSVEREVVWLDRDRLEKIVLNLAVNAVKFTPPGGTVGLAADTGGGELTLTVTDTGRGMSKEELDNVFVRFWQADMSAKRKHRGAGIGLALVQSLTESMHGEVKVESVPGKGTTFTVVMPAPAPEEGAVDLYEEQTRDVLEKFNERARISGIAKFKQDQAGGDRGRLIEIEAKKNAGAEKNGKGARKRLLVADDEDAMRNFIARQLGEYEVVGARDGAEAWQLVQDEKFDLIVLDLMMPRLDGIEVTSLVRDNAATARIPVILVTAQASEAPRLKALEAGVNDFLAKPFSSVELRVRIKNLLTSSEFEVWLAQSKTDLEVAYSKLKEQETILVQAEKLSSLGRMSAGIVHEVNNPLNYTKTALHALKTFDRQIPEHDREDYLDVLGDAQEGVNRVIGIISDLRAFTRGDAAATSDVVLVDVVESARRLASEALIGLDFTVDVPGELEVEGNEGQLCQLFMNLFQNAARAVLVRESGEQGAVHVKASKGDGGGTTVSVRDNGCGISKQDIEQMFEPFFTKNDVGEGMGLGLPICHRIIEQHGATIEVESELGRYTEMIIRFPAKGSGKGGGL